MAGKKLEYQVSTVFTIQDEASKQLKGIDKQIADLTKKKATIPVDADTDGARKEIAALDKELEALQKQKASIEVKAKVDSALAAMDEIASEAKKADAAVEALGEALGPELAARVDVQSAVSGFQRMDLSMDDVIANADRLADKFREIDRQDPGGALAGSFARAKAGTDELGRSADSSKSALANMVGNAAQDVGSLGGVAGSAGVAIGQMAEYMADAALEGESLGSVVANFAKVAGPIAAISAVLGVVTGVMQTQKDRAEAAARATEEYGKAMEESANDAVGLADVLKDNVDRMHDFTGAATTASEALTEVASNIPLIGGLFETPPVDVVEVLDDIGIGFLKVGKAIGGNVHDWKDIQRTLEEFHRIGRITDNQFNQTTKFINEQRDAVKRAEQDMKFHNVALGEANALYGELLAKKDPLGQYPELWNNVIEAIRTGTLDTKKATDAINLLHNLLGLAPEDVLTTALGELDQRQKDAAKSAEELAKKQQEVHDALVDVGDQWKAMRDEVSEKSFQEAIDQFDSLSQLDMAQMRQDTVASFDDVKGAIRDAAKEVKGWKKMDLTPDSFKELKGMPDEFGKITDAVSGMRSSIQTELKGEFDTGGIKAFADKFDFFAGQVREQFTTMFKGMGLSDKEVQKQVDAILSDLGLLPDQKTIVIKFTRDKEATNALDLFMSDIEKIEEANPSVDIRAKLARGDIDDALVELNALRISQGQDPIVLATDIDTKGAEQATTDARQAAQDYLTEHPTQVSMNTVPPTDAEMAATKKQIESFFKNTEVGLRLSNKAFDFLSQDSGGITPWPGGIAGERRPEIINNRYLAVGPTYVPPGTRVTSGRRTAHILRTRGTRGLRRYDSGGVVGGPSTVNVNINTGAVISDTFDMMRLVHDSVRRAERLLPRHA